MMATMLFPLAIQFSIYSVLSQTYTEWTGYGYITDMVQLSPGTQFKIRHIHGKYFIMNYNLADGPFYQVNVFGRCTLDTSRAPYSYFTIEEIPDYAPYTTFCGQPVTSYKFAHTVSTGDYLSVSLWNNGDLDVSVQSGTHSSYERNWLASECDGILNVDTFYVGGYFPRYYTHLSILQDLTTPTLTYPSDFNLDACYDPGSWVWMTGAVSTESEDDAWFTFEVNAPPNMTINGGSGPENYYLGYSYLTDLSQGDVVVMRLISGAYIYDKLGDDRIYGRCYYAWKTQKWKVKIDTSGTDDYYYFKNYWNEYLCKEYIAGPPVEYRLVSSPTLDTTDCYWTGNDVFTYGDRGYTRLKITELTGGPLDLCIDTTPSDYDQCDDTLTIGLTTNCGGDAGGLYFEKVNV